MRTPAGSVILWVTPASTTLPRSMLGVSQSFFSLLQKNVLNTRRWDTRADLRLAMVTWIEMKFPQPPAPATRPRQTHPRRV